MRSTRVLALLLLLPLAAPLAACGSERAVTEPAPTTTATTVEATTFAPSLGIDLSAAGWTRTSTGLYYRTLSTPAGASAAAANGQAVSVRYTGWLSNGTQFESSTFPFVLGAREVIAGWDQGIVGMRVGERRRLLIPPSLGYGAQARGPIPANAVLVFDVELLSAT
jgi:FKBP-type peptidyl-prolyl cis-trans isomerase